MSGAGTLPRKDRRAQQAKAAQIYGIKGPESLSLHEAYNALARGEVSAAVQGAHPITQSHPSNRHAWIILGGAALAQREGKTAQAFFEQAAKVAPNDPVMLSGMAKAQVLQAEVEAAVDTAGRAFAAGSDDAGLAGLYMDLMARLSRRIAAADVLAPMVARSGDAGLCLKLADMLVDAEEAGRAAPWYLMAHDIDPGPEAHRIGRLRALVSRCQFDEAEPLARDLLNAVHDRDAVMSILLLVLRALRRHDEVAELAQNWRFSTPEAYAQSRGVMANLNQDLGNWSEAEADYLEAVHVAGTPGRMAKAYGVYLFREGRIAEGMPYYTQRFNAQQRARIPQDNAAPERLAPLSRLVVMSEQGVGDQLALLPLLRLAPLAPAAQVQFVAEPRVCALLEGNGLGVVPVDMGDFLGRPQEIETGGIVYLGDLTRYLDGAQPGGKGCYLAPDAARVATLRARYGELGQGAPVIGLAWNSASLAGHLRSVPLLQMLEAVPQGALVVNLQYGDQSGAIAAAQAARPDLRVLSDDSVDQMTDLAGFAAQVAALDHIVTIDNTTAHMAGAVGHRNTHVLIPEGAENMWYWGRSGAQAADGTDPWYGTLHLHRQVQSGDWAAPLAAIAGKLGG